MKEMEMTEVEGGGVGGGWWDHVREAPVHTGELRRHSPVHRGGGSLGGVR